MGKFRERVKRLMHAWNAFDYSATPQGITDVANLGTSYTYRPDRPRRVFQGEKTIISAIYNRMAIDTASVAIRHVRLNQNRQYQEDISSGLSNCLTVEANIDQAATHFRQDVVQTLFDYGVAAVVPVDTTLDPNVTGGYDVLSMRVGRVVTWHPQHVTVELYNEKTGVRQNVTVPKTIAAIIENPLYTVMNEPSSTLQRLIRKLNLLDTVDEQSASGNLDIIIQLPYTIKTEGRRAEADKRLKEIEFQLRGSQYGIAYVDGTEKITQLNRPAENNLMTQVEYLTKLLYSQLGITDEVMNGTADEQTMLNYHNRTVKPILTAITEAMTRAFLTKTARSQGQAVIFIRDPFALVPVKDLAEIVDKFTRNEVASSNDMRSVIGWRPSSDPKADQLLNKNIPAAYGELPENGVALKRPNLPPKSPFPQVPAIPSQGVSSQNGSSN